MLQSGMLCKTRSAMVVAVVLSFTWVPVLAADTEAHLVIHDAQIVAPGSSDELAKQLVQALEDRGDDYVPRTQHKLANGAPAFINRLILEDSPYLLQHAHNPVNWYPWGEEAFALAKAQDKPIFSLNWVCHLSLVPCYGRGEF